VIPVLIFKRVCSYILCISFIILISIKLLIIGLELIRIDYCLYVTLVLSFYFHIVLNVLMADLTLKFQQLFILT